MHKTADQIENDLLAPHLPPQVGGGNFNLTRRISSSSGVSLIEWEKPRLSALLGGSHENLLGIHREMREATAKPKKRLLRIEDGVAAKTIAAYIDLNPVRAGMVKDPADYRWSSYSEAIGGGTKGNGKTARAGLVRALRAHQGLAANAECWADGVSREYRKLLMSGAIERSAKRIGKNGQVKTKVLRKGISKAEAAQGTTANENGELPFGKMLRCRIRYFTEGAVIGSRGFVNEAFSATRERFGPNRKTGARKMRGGAGAAAASIWSLRDLRKGITG